MRTTTKYREIMCLLGLVGAAAFCRAAQGVEFAGGTGEPNDPYRIATAAQLLGIDEDPNLRSMHYILVAPIDLSGMDFSEPVISSFSGSFDGNGYTIRNLRTTGGSMDGLFYRINATGEVKNLGVVDVYLRGSGASGTLAFLNFGSIDNCYSTGQIINLSGIAGGLVAHNFGGAISNSYSSVTVTGTIEIGGLVGTNSGTVSFCHATGEVTGDSEIGGLVGINSGKITASYSGAIVTGNTLATGGLVGTNSGAITSCYANATVTGYNMVGGLVGENTSSISSGYSTGTVTGEETVGGLVGYNEGGISSSYSVATVDSWGWNVGGLVGYGDAPANCYFLDPSDGGGPDNDIGTALTDAQMREQASFVGWDFWGTTEDGDDDLWFMPENAYPVLPWQTEITGLYTIPDVAGLSLEEAQATLTAAGFVPGEVSYDDNLTVSPGCVIYADPCGLASLGTTVDLVVSTAGTYNWSTNAGDGTPANPYQIETASQLESLMDRSELWDKSFVLAADVDMVGRTYSTALIAPDTNNVEAGYQGTPFSGVFNGQGHVIRNLTLIADKTVGSLAVFYEPRDYVGLFGMIAKEGRIENLNLIDAHVETGTGLNSYVGVLAGFNAGIVSGCSASGYIYGGCGDGLVGANTGTLTGSTANITRKL